MIKMLRKNENGEIETFYVDTFEEKRLHDAQRKKYRQLNTKREIPENKKKQDLRHRQKLAKELREIKVKLKGGNYETKH